MSVGGGGEGHFADTGGYGGNFGGAGGAARNAGGSGTEHGLLGFGGMSPGGYNASTYAANVAGIPGTPGFGARQAAAQAAYRARLASKYPGFNLNPFGGTPAKPGVTAPTTTTKKPVQIDPKTGLPVNQTVPTTSTPVLPDLQTPAYGSPTSQYSGYGAPMNNFSPGWDPHGYGTGASYGNYNDQPKNNLGGWGGPSAGPTGMDRGGLALGGPALPGQTYTVGENGPETLQMGPGGGGMVTPHNPMDRMRGPMGPGPGGPGQPPLGGMRPEMMQQFHQLLQQWRQNRPDRPQGPMTPDMRGDWRQGIQDWRGQRPDRPQMGGPPMPPQQPQVSPGPAPQQPGQGFGLSGLGQPGVLGQIRNRPGFGGAVG